MLLYFTAIIFTFYYENIKEGVNLKNFYNKEYHSLITLRIQQNNYKDLHELCGRATPDQMQEYKLSLQLYKTFHFKTPSPDWMQLNLNFVNASRQTKFRTNNTNRLKIGWNVLSNRFWHLNGKIDLNWLNLFFTSYKIQCKRRFQ